VSVCERGRDKLWFIFFYKIFVIIAENKSTYAWKNLGIRTITFPAKFWFIESCVGLSA